MPAQQLPNRTLCFLVKRNPPTHILLGYKKVRFGAGKFAGIGGTVEPGETVASAALRGMGEETGVRVLEQDLQVAGRLTFDFPCKPSWSQVVHVFLTTAWTGEPAESEEMLPAWFAVADIPYDRMWQDAAFWLPPILNGERIRATFTFNDDNETIARIQPHVWDSHTA